MSYAAEEAVIGSLLMDQNSMNQIYGILEPDMFMSKMLGLIFHEFQKGYAKRYNVDIIVLEQKLRNSDIPSDMLISQLQKCMDSVATSAYIQSHARVIENDYKAKRLNDFLNTIQTTPDNLTDNLRKISEEVDVLRGSKKNKSKTLAEITKENKDSYFCENNAPKILLGFEKLDDLLGGLEGGDMIVIGARPGVGKSALVTQITSNLSKIGKRIGFFNLEMQTKQMYERFVVSESGIGLTRLKRATRFLGDEKERFDKANEVLEKSENIIITTGSKSAGDIRAESLHMDYDVIIIDYLQLVKTDSRYKGNRTAEVGQISKTIKELAMELNIPIIALSQLNRVSQMRDDKEPTMSELREAGDIEQDASVIILLWNPDPNDLSKKGCKVEKQRQGQLGKVSMRFNGDMMKFEESNDDLSPKKEEAWHYIDSPF